MAIVLTGNISGGFVSAVEIPTSMVLFPNIRLNHKLLLLYHSFLMELDETIESHFSSVSNALSSIRYTVGPE